MEGRLTLRARMKGLKELTESKDGVFVLVFFKAGFESTSDASGTGERGVLDFTRYKLPYPTLIFAVAYRANAVQ